MDEQRAAAQRLLALAHPFLTRDDSDGLAEILRESWSPDCLKLLLSSPDYETVETAATCLGLIGEMFDAPALAALLGHVQPVVADAAEDALWSIWFRAGGPVAQAVLYRISNSIRNGETQNVAPMLSELIKSQPTYAEAHHQRGQAYYLQNDPSHALRDAKRACELNPSHFPAFALAGHAYAALGRYQEALKSYRDALRIHPQMPGIRASIQQIRARLSPALGVHAPA